MSWPHGPRCSATLRMTGSTSVAALLLDSKSLITTACNATQDWAMEWPRPLPPNVQLVGALLPTLAKPLPPDFEARALPP